MGCCMSSTDTKAPAATAPGKHVGSDKEASLKLNGFSYETRAPQPASVEEETVKEVLSETPKPKPLPKQEPIITAEMKQDLLEEEDKETKIGAYRVEAFGKIQEKQNLGSNEEIMSEGAEICSVSISESVSTLTNVTDKRDNEEEEDEQEVRQRQRVISQPPAKPPPPPPRNGFKRDRVMNQSPARRIGNNGSAVKCGRERRDPGENFRRRSRSPATATTRSAAGMGQSPSARRANRSPGRVRSGPIENSTHGGTRIDDIDDDNNNEKCGTNETLENPLVSLECFIFL